MLNQNLDGFNKVAVIELFGHLEVLRDVCYILQESTQELWIFTTTDIAMDLQPIVSHPNQYWTIRQENQSICDFFQEQEELISTCEIIFLLTATMPFSNYNRLPFLQKSILLIHNAHTFLRSWRHIAWSSLLSSDILLRIVRFYLLGEYFYLRRLMQKISVWAFPSEIVLEYAISKNLIPASQHAIYLPLGLFQDTKPNNEKSKLLRICIPGTIKSLGRDYRLVHSAFLQLLPKIDVQMELILLGRPRGRYGTSIQASFKQLHNEFSHFHVRVFQKTVEQKEYDSYLKKADFLIIPLTPLKRYDAFDEHMGYSTISGAIHDMTRFGIPALIPAFYPLEDWRNKLAVRFEDEDQLLEILTDWLKNRTYLTRRKSYLRSQTDQGRVLGQFIADLQQIVN